MLRSIASTSARQLTAAARPQPTARFLSTSLRLSLPAQGSVAPTTSESSAGTDRGGSLPSDAQEGAQADAKGLKKDEQSTNTSASSAANAQKGTGASANKDGISGDGNPLKPGAANRSYHTSAVLRATRAAEQQPSAQHPKNTEIDHLSETPSLSEEVVHAEKHTTDPLSATAKASSKIEGAAETVQDAASSVSGQAADLASKAAGAVKGAASAVKDTINKATGTKSFSTSARQSDKPKEAKIDHLNDKPSHSEEAVHGERHGKDPLPDSKKKNQGTKEKGGVKDKVSELKSKTVDALPDGESTLRSIGGSN